MSKHNLHTLYTAQYRYSGLDRTDITVKGMDPYGKYFAPTWNMVTGIKDGSISEEEYIKQYLQILEEVPTYVFDWLLKPETRTFVCFCSKEAFCHRNILVKYLIQIFGNRLIYGGFKENIV